MTDIALIAAHRTGDGRAFADLVARHRSPLLGFFRSRVPSEAEELHQELWTRVARGLDQRAEFPDDGRFRAWLFTIARNLVRDHRRRVGARPELVSVPDLPPVGSSARSDAAATQRELVLAVEAALAELNPDVAEVLRLRLSQGLKFTEIAERQQAPLNTVLGRMHRGLKRLRAELVARGIEGASA